MKHVSLTRAIIGAYYDVYNTLGYGFLEKVYENALFRELVERGFAVAQQSKIQVFYKRTLVGTYYADLVVNESVVVEIKRANELAREHEVQLLNYLRATQYEVGLLLNFGRKPEHKRKIFDNKRKLR